MPRDETRDVLIICDENGAPSNEYAGFWYHRTLTEKSLPIAPKDSLERFSPHSQLVDLDPLPRPEREVKDELQRDPPSWNLSGPEQDQEGNQSAKQRRGQGGYFWLTFGNFQRMLNEGAEVECPLMKW